MTKEEYESIKVGDQIETWMCGSWIQVKVKYKTKFDKNFLVRTTGEKIGFTIKGQVSNIVGELEEREWFVNMKQTRLPPKKDNLEANVYADWLEDAGHVLAATALREQFPISESIKEVTK